MGKKISVVIPTNNNKHILKTISSVREIADEIIVVNSSGENETFKNQKSFDVMIRASKVCFEVVDQFIY